MRQNGSTIRVSSIDWLTLTLVIIGALNWGLVGLGFLITGQQALASWNLVNLLLGWSPILEALVYLLVGIAGLYELYFAYQLRTVESPRREVTAD